MRGYVFISNGTKPSIQQQYSKDKIKLTNVSRPCLKTALKMGRNVFYGTNRYQPQYLECELPVKLYDSHTYRSITNFRDNMIAYRNLSNLVRNNDIEIIHCNTPVGGVIGRLVGRRYNVKKVIYTAHGFHFYKGAPLVNRIIYKFAEKIMAHWTDIIVTINEEDFHAAKKFKLKKNGRVYKVHGVGIDVKAIKDTKINKNSVKEDLGFKANDILFISAGRLDSNKNYLTSIMAISEIDNNNIHYLICGEGPEEEKLRNLVDEKGLTDKVHFMGFRTDVIELMKISDVFLFTTLREGLPRSLMEAMACGLPCIVSKIRGNVDLIDDSKGGYLCESYDYIKIAENIKKLIYDKQLRNKMGIYNQIKINSYDNTIVEKEIENIYLDIKRSLSDICN